MLLEWLARLQEDEGSAIPSDWEEELIWEIGADTIVPVLIRMTLNDLITLQILRNELEMTSPLQALEKQDIGGIYLRTGTKWGLYGNRGGSMTQSLEEDLEFSLDCIAWVLPDSCEELDGLEAWDADPEDRNREAMPIVWGEDGWPLWLLCA